MDKLLKRAALIGAVAGAAYAVKSYFDRDTEAVEGEVQISFEDGTSETLSSADSEELVDIARSVLEAGGS